MIAGDLTPAHAGRTVTYRGKTGLHSAVLVDVSETTSRDVRLHLHDIAQFERWFRRGEPIHLHAPTREDLTMTTTTDVVHHPKHYGADRFGIECIEFTCRMTGTPSNGFKYVFRHAEKGGVEDLRKALVYLAWADEDNVNPAVTAAAGVELKQLADQYLAPAMEAVDQVYRALLAILDGDYAVAGGFVARRIAELVA